MDTFQRIASRWSCPCGCKGQNWNLTRAVVGQYFKGDHQCPRCNRTLIVLGSGDMKVLVVSKDQVQDHEYVNEHLTTSLAHYKEFGDGDLRLFVLPEVPQNMSVFLLGDNNTQKEFTQKSTRGISPPIHPLRLEHNDFWDGVFEHLPEGVSVKEIENRYYKDHSLISPWYELKYRDSKIVVGNRKRVISISVSNPDQKTRKIIQELGEGDAVTHSKATDRGEAYIHAWRKNKLMEYLSKIIESIPSLDFTIAERYALSCISEHWKPVGSKYIGWNEPNGVSQIFSKKRLKLFLRKKIESFEMTGEVFYSSDKDSSEGEELNRKTLHEIFEHSLTNGEKNIEEIEADLRRETDMTASDWKSCLCWILGGESELQSYFFEVHGEALEDNAILS